MEDELEQPSDVSELMPCPLDWSMSEIEYLGGPNNNWTFWSRRPNDELEYQCKKMAAPVVPTDTGIDKDTIRSILERNSFFRLWIVQFWAPVKVNGLTFLSTADQPFLLAGLLNKRLCTYRRHCVDTLIPVDIDDANGEALLGPHGRAYIRGFSEYTLDIKSNSAVEFLLLKHATQSGIQNYCAIPVFKLHDKHCVGVFEIASTRDYPYYPYISKDLDLGSSELYIPCWPMDILSKISEPWKLALDQIKAGLAVVGKRRKFLFAQIWIPDPQFSSIKALISASRSVCSRAKSKYFDFSHDSTHCYIQRGKAVVGRAFSSQGSCFCNDVTLLSLTEYPLVPSAREAGLARCFAICLRSKCINDFICVVEYFLPPNEMVDRAAQTLNKLLSTMKEQLPDVTVASGQELGQRMVVEVVKISPSDELDSFEIGQSLPSVQSLQDEGETAEINSLIQQSNLQNVENNVATAPVVPFCSSQRLDSFNCEGTMQVDLLLRYSTGAAVTNRRRVDMDVSHDEADSYLSNTDAIICGTSDHSGWGGDSMISDPNIVLSSTSTDDHHQQLLEWQVPLDQIEEGLDVVCQAHSLPFAQIWIPDSRSSSIKAVIGRRSYGTSSSMYFNFVNASGLCFIQRGKAVVGRAFSSQGSCFCKDVTLLSLTEYPLVPSAREAGFTRCFAICLRNKCINDFICVVEYFLPPNEMVDRDAETFLNMILSAMKEQLPGVVVASGKELGQRMLVEVIKVSPFDELDFFEIGQPLPSVLSLQDGGEATEIDSLCKQSNLQSGEHNVTTALIVPSCSSHKRDSSNCEGPVQVDILHPHPTEAALANRGRVDVDIAPDHTEAEKDTSDMMQLDSRFEQPNVEIVSTGNGRNNDKVDDSDIATCRRQLVEAEAINEESYFIVSQSTPKRIFKEYDISRWPHQKIRKVNPHVSEGVSLLGVEQYVRDQPCPDLSQEKGTDYFAHKPSPATGKACDSVMTVKVTYRDDIIKFKLTASSTRVELQDEVEKRLNISLEKFSIKYQDEDDDWVTITGDSDLREGMNELRLLGKSTMKLLVTPKSDT